MKTHGYACTAAIAGFALGLVRAAPAFGNTVSFTCGDVAFFVEDGDLLDLNPALNIVEIDFACDGPNPITPDWTVAGRLIGTTTRGEAAWTLLTDMVIQRVSTNPTPIEGVMAFGHGFPVIANAVTVAELDGFYDDNTAGSFIDFADISFDLFEAGFIDPPAAQSEPGPVFFAGGAGPTFAVQTLGHFVLMNFQVGVGDTIVLPDSLIIHTIPGPSGVLLLLLMGGRLGGSRRR